MITLTNGSWGAKISEMGAELKSLANLATGQEHIWNGDPAWWNGSAPVLFPVIGGLKDGAYSFEGKQYKLPSHGFARGASSASPARGPIPPSSHLCPARRPVKTIPLIFL